MISVYLMKIPEIGCDEIEKRLFQVSFYRREKINKMKMPKAKMLELGATQLLNYALFSYNLREKDMEYVVDKNGKPYFAKDGLPQFNISHSGFYVMVGIGSDEKVGVDVQHIETYDERIAERFFAPGECSVLKKAPEEQRSVLFHKIFAMKESYVKYLGTGFYFSPQDFDVFALDDVTLTCECFDDYVYSVCTDTSDVNVTFIPYGDADGLYRERNGF